MRRRLSLLTVGVLLAAAIAAVPFAASKPDAARFVLTERNELTGPTSQAGTWAAAGAINDAGTVVVDEFTVTSTVEGEASITGTHVLTGEHGTISIETNGTVRPFPPPEPPRVFVEGGWHIVGGTGDYADLAGDGHLHVTVDFTNGQLTIAREGTAYHTG